MIIAVTNLKGGVGKSTIARNLAAYFIRRGAKTCIIDTDLEQRTTCDWQERREDSEMRIPVFPMTTVQALPKDVETHSRDGYKIIIIDGVPQMDQVATRTMLLCDILLIPLTPSIDDLKSFERFLSRFEEVKIHREEIPAFLVLNKFNGRSTEDKEVRTALKLFSENGIKPLKSTLGDRVAHRRASKYGLTAFEWEDERAKNEVVELCKELEAIMKSLTPNRSKHGKARKKINH
jgi:chromosome partitioning protein